MNKAIKLLAESYAGSNCIDVNYSEYYDCKLLPFVYKLINDKLNLDNQKDIIYDIGLALGTNLEDLNIEVTISINYSSGQYDRFTDITIKLDPQLIVNS